MKKWTAALVCLLLVLLCAAASAEAKIDEKTFPDKQFRAFVEDNFDGNKDGKLSSAEIAAVKKIDCYDKGIQSLKGIEVFSALQELICVGNELTELDVSKNTNLMRLTCGANQLTSLELGKNTKLIAVACETNQLASIDLSGLKNLKVFSCAGNPMKTLDVSGCPKLAALVKQGKPAQYETGFYGWWKKSKYFPNVYLFVSQGLEVSADPLTATVSGLNFRLDHSKNTAEFTGAANQNAAAVTIPDTIRQGGKAFQVTGIAEGACANMKKLAKVTIGKNVETIGKKAFDGCEKLKGIVITTTKLKAKNVGGSAFRTGAANGTVKCPKDKLEAYQKILFKKGIPEDTKFTK